MAFLRKEGRYWKVYWYHDKKFHKRSTRTSDKSLAEKIRRKIEDEIAAGKFNIDQIEHKSIKLEDFLEEALDYSETNKSQRTYEIDRLVCQSFLNFCGDIYLNIVSVKIIEEYKSYLATKKKATTVNIYLRHLSSVFSLAVKYGYIQGNPFKSIRKIPVPKKQPVFLSRDKSKELLDKLKGRDLQIPVMLALYTGARISEICELQWKNVDLKRSIVKLKGKGEKERTIPIPDILKNYLGSTQKSSDYVLSGIRDRREITRKFRQAADDIGLQDFKFHNLRDTYASWLAQAGRSIQEIQLLLGHTSIKTTMIYAHLAPENLRDAVRIFDVENSDTIP